VSRAKPRFPVAVYAELLRMYGSEGGERLAMQPFDGEGQHLFFEAAELLEQAIEVLAECCTAVEKVGPWGDDAGTRLARICEHCGGGWSTRSVGRPEFAHRPDCPYGAARRWLETARWKPGSYRPVLPSQILGEFPRHPRPPASELDGEEVVHAATDDVRHGIYVVEGKPDKCHNCGAGEFYAGFGLAGGGFGPYWICAKCEAMHKAPEPKEEA